MKFPTYQVQNFKSLETTKTYSKSISRTSKGPPKNLTHELPKLTQNKQENKNQNKKKKKKKYKFPNI